MENDILKFEFLNVLSGQYNSESVLALHFVFDHVATAWFCSFHWTT